MFSEPTVKSLTYTGDPLELINAGSSEDGTLYYAVTTGNVAPTDEQDYVTSIPTGTNVWVYAQNGCSRKVTVKVR